MIPQKRLIYTWIVQLGKNYAFGWLYKRKGGHVASLEDLCICYMCKFVSSEEIYQMDEMVDSNKGIQFPKIMNCVGRK